MAAAISPSTAALGPMAPTGATANSRFTTRSRTATGTTATGAGSSGANSLRNRL